eukprot:GDKI01006491.1.p1 GENE.GDKI01006491.1~~GDKI01006491.1.p1  ORF type:complete len:234 (-),score=42.09 GDKI01006491.1:24-725(-)
MGWFGIAAPAPKPLCSFHAVGICENNPCKKDHETIDRAKKQNICTYFLLDMCTKPHCEWKHTKEIAEEPVGFFLRVCVLLLCITGVIPMCLCALYNITPVEQQKWGVWVVLANGLALLAMWGDKVAAEKKWWPFPEYALSLYAFLGGSVGVVCGMHVFEHKKVGAKTHWWLVFWCCAHMCVCAFFYLVPEISADVFASVSKYVCVCGMLALPFFLWVLTAVQCRRKVSHKKKK